MIPKLAFNDARATLNTDVIATGIKYSNQTPIMKDFCPIADKKNFASKVSSLEIDDIKLIALSNTPLCTERTDKVGSEIIIPISGEATTFIGNSKFVVQNNQMAFFCRAETRRSLQSTRSFVKIQFDLQHLHFTHETMLGFPITAIDLGSRFYPLIHGRISFMKLFLITFSQIDLLEGDESALRRIGFRDSIYRLCCGLIFQDLFQQNRLDEKQPTYIRREIKRLCEWINANLEETISLTDMEKMSGLSARVLQYWFQKHFSMRPKEWLRKQRLHRAREKLMSSSYQENITSIAYNLCFPSTSDFARHYRSEFGELPSKTLKRRSLI